ncbi:hypothetical protein IHV09_22005 [Fictibacillus sp. 23RED33]|nr:hypothetical protein [Fictibacillus sp. 23RED33]MBH0176234.1 hypothetical protein [Fictibacillus sp. 23RED33]
MEIGGLMAYAFKVFLGNPDIMAALITWAVLVTLALTVIEIFKETKL